MVFGKPAGGKSTLSIKLSKLTGIELYPLDLIQYRPDGSQFPKDHYNKKHDEIITREQWIIDGLGTMSSFWNRIDASDTLINIDLPYSHHYWWGVKRLLKSFYKKPEGWPERSSVLKGTLNTWKYLKLSKKFWTEELYQKIQQRSADKRLVRIQSHK